MRAAFEHVEPGAGVSWSAFRATAPHYAFSWHFHPELELTLITRGSGTWFAGDTIGDYRAGDLILTGPDLPHTYVSEPASQGQDAVVIQFRPDFLGAALLERPEFGSLAVLFERARRGLLLSGAPWAGRMLTLGELEPPWRTLALLGILVELAGEPGVREMAVNGGGQPLDRAAGRRMAAVVDLLHAAYAEPLSLADVAAVAHLTPPAVSRLFRRATGTTVTEYLNRVRINAACRLLSGTGLPIADIASRCGYRNLSHFNRQFLALRSMPPRDYRRLLTLDAGG